MRHLVTGLVLLWLAIPASGHAGERNSKWSDWRIIAHDGSYATSDCIGTFDTPDCIADTWAACDVLGYLKDGAKDYIPENHRPMCRHLLWGMGGVPAARIRWREPFHDPEIYLYRIHTWTALEEDVNQYLRTDMITGDVVTKGLPSVLPGDTVLEFYPAGCYSRYKCVQEQKADDMKACPPVSCQGFDLFGPKDQDYLRIGCDGYPDPDGILMPLTFIILRKVDGSWFITYEEDSTGTYKRTCDLSFMPDYWRKRK